MGQQGEGMGWCSGDRGREVMREVPLAKAVRDETMRSVPLPLVRAVEESDMGDCGKVTFVEALARCTTLNMVGCTICWLLSNYKRLSKTSQNAKLLTGIFNSGVWRRVARRRSALPICEGDFTELVEQLQRVSLEEVTTDSFSMKWSGICWRMAACYACNFLVEGAIPFMPGRWSRPERMLAEAVAEAVDRFHVHGQTAAPDVSEVEKELKDKRVNYVGEEVGICHVLTLKQVVSSLPPETHGGVIDVLEFVSPATRELLISPEELVVEDFGQELPRLQGRVHIKEDDLMPICNELIQRGVCKWIPISDVVRFRGRPVLNGLFGVPKPSHLDDGSPILRLIMNLVPANAITRQIRGHVKNLPHITSWLSTYVEEGEFLHLWQSDMSNAFYLFRLPPQWCPYLSFNIRRRGHDVGLAGDTEEYCLACTVLPMGWSSSVGVILWTHNLPREAQLVRHSMLPLWMVGILGKAKEGGRAWWHVYLDNFAAGEVSINGQISGGDLLHDMAEKAWKETGVISSEKKRKRAVSNAQELGAFIDGQHRTLGAAPERLMKLIQATFWLIGQHQLQKRLVQVVAGRWVHVFQFRRPSMALLSEVWQLVTNKGTSRELEDKVRRELFACMCSLPLLNTYLGAEVVDVMTASDASSWGGAVGIARELTDEGKDFVHHSIDERRPRKIPVLVISLFNGIGGAFRVYDLLGLIPSALVAFDVHKPAQRVVSRRWPHAELRGDVKLLDKTMILGWLSTWPEVEEVHLWGGFPCTDLSSVKANAAGLEGKNSSLFYEIPRIKTLLKETLPRHVKVKEAVENVASMPKEECDRISDVLGVWPYHFDPVQAVPMHRPRLCWTSERVETALTDLHFIQREHWTEVHASAPYPEEKSWISPGWSWGGQQTGVVLPTALKSIVRVRPPPKPAGLHRCDSDTRSRWVSDEFRFPPYHYLERYLFWKDNKWRLANSSEKELLLGYGYGHTELCYSASDIKRSKMAWEDERLSLLGDSFSIHSFVIIGAALCSKFLGKLSYKTLANRMGMAPGACVPLFKHCPLSRSLCYGNVAKDPQHTPDDLNRILLAKTNHTGSDVRIITGEILNPKAVVRQSIQADWWQWKHVFNTKWKQKEHINCLELRSILLAVQYHISHLKHKHMRIFHATDSYVSMSVVSKGRSGSKNLSRILKHLNGLLLGFGLQLVVVHVESSENPTDGASRNMEVLLSKDESRTRD